MTLPEDEYANFESVDGPERVVQGNLSTVTLRSSGEGDVIRTARTKRDGSVVSHTNYALANKREAGKDVLGREAGHVVAAADRKPIVTNWQGMDDYDECPPDYDTFDRQYRSYVTHLVWTMNVAPREIDDVTQEIMIRFLERDSLGEFDRGWATRSATGKSVFRSYLSRFVVTYARGKHRNNVRYVKRYNLLCDAPVGDDKGTSWLDQYDAETAEHEAPMTHEAEFSDLVASLGNEVGPEVMSVVTDLVEETGKIKLSDLAKRLGVSARQARLTRDRLQEAARAAVR